MREIQKMFCEKGKLQNKMHDTTCMKHRWYHVLMEMEMYFCKWRENFKIHKVAREKKKFHFSVLFELFTTHMYCIKKKKET